MSLANHFRIKDNVDVYYADIANVIMNAIRGNKVESGGGLTGTATLLTSVGTHVNVAAGSVYVTGVKKTMTSLAIDLNTEYGVLTSGQERWVYIYVASTGAVTKVAGSAAVIGQAIPPDFDTLPADLVMLGRIILTFGDTTVDVGDITDLRLDLPNITATDKIATDTINEKTANAGVTIDGVLIKDGTIGDTFLDDTIGAGNRTLAELQDFHLDGAVNGAWINLSWLQGHDNGMNADIGADGSIIINNTTSSFFYFELTGKEFSKTGLDLYISKIRIGATGNASNYINTHRSIIWQNDSSPTIDDFGLTDVGEGGVFDEVLFSFTAKSLAAARKFVYRLSLALTSAGVLQIHYAQAFVYYA